MAQQTSSSSPARLQEIVNEAAATALRDFAGKKLQSNQLAVTLIDLRDWAKPAQASFRGDAPFYPASVIKLFYLTAAHQWLQEEKLKETDELRRAMRDMIVESSNDATQYVIDLMTGTTGGPELTPDEMKVWSEKRNAVNRYFAGLDYTNINVNQKPWGDGPYGRERLFVGKDYENRNKLTTSATARLLGDIVRGQAVTATRSVAMMNLLERNPFQKGADEQATDYTAKGLPAGAKLWSKAGWTSTVRHDAAYVELARGDRFVLVIFTSGHSKDAEIIPTVARVVIEEMGK